MQSDRANLCIRIRMDGQSSAHARNRTMWPACRRAPQTDAIYSTIRQSPDGNDMGIEPGDYVPLIARCLVSRGPGREPTHCSRDRNQYGSPTALRVINKYICHFTLSPVTCCPFANASRLLQESGRKNAPANIPRLGVLPSLCRMPASTFTKGWECLLPSSARLEL